MGQAEPKKASDLDIYNNNENDIDIAINSDSERDEKDEIDDNDDDIDIDIDIDDDNENVENPRNFEMRKTDNPFSFHSGGAVPRCIAYHFDVVYIHGQE